MNKKIIALEELAGASQRIRQAGKKLVVTNGCFDLLHVGHVRYLRSARELGDILVVGLNGDRSVGEVKGPGRPINNEKDRAEVLAALECVDLVVVFPEVRATGFLERTAADIYVKGGDYTTDTLDPEERAALEKAGTEIKIIPFESGYSTSVLIKKLRASE